MSRSMTAAARSALMARVVRAVHLVRLDFDDATVVFTDAPFDVIHGGLTYKGVGSLGRISPLAEDAEITPHGVTIDLSGIPPALLAQGLDGHIQGRPVVIHVALLDAGHQVIGDPVEVFRGRMDHMNLAIGQTAAIALSCESRLADWNRARVRRFNHQDQQDLYPGDLGFEFAEEMVDKEILWGVTP